jgi:hypothetical protein
MCFIAAPVRSMSLKNVAISRLFKAFFSVRPTSWTSECCCFASYQLLGCGFASMCCCVLFTAAFLLQSFYPLPLLVVLAPFTLFIVLFSYARGGRGAPCCVAAAQSR